MNLVKYLPHEVRKIEEFKLICKVEEPEFEELDDIVRRVFDESFIESASIYGISRLERIAGIYPNETDSLEDRRFRLLVRYNFSLPYTERILIERLDNICGEGNYTLNIEYNKYIIDVTTHINTQAQYDELLFLLEKMIPVNMLILSSNTLLNKYDKDLYYGSVLIEKKTVNISNDLEKEYLSKSNVYLGQAISEYKNVSISNDLEKTYTNSDNIYVSGIISEYKAVEIKMEGMI